MLEETTSKHRAQQRERKQKTDSKGVSEGSREGRQGAVQRGFLEEVSFAQSLKEQQNLEAKTGEKAFLRESETRRPGSEGSGVCLSLYKAKGR